MTLDDCFQQHQGTAVDVDGVPADNGQCVQWADVVLRDVYGFPIHYGNAIDWWNSPGELLNHFDRVPYGVGSYPKKGDFVIYNSGVGSVYGHIDVAASDGDANGFSGYDSNWDHTHFHDANGYPTLHQVQHGYANYIIGFLRPKGNSNKMFPNEGDLTNFYQRTGWPGHAPNPNDVAYWTTGTGNDGWAAGADNVWKDLAYSVTLYTLDNAPNLDAANKTIADLQAEVGKAGGTIDPKLQAEVDNINTNTTQTTGIVQKILDFLGKVFK